MRNKRLRLSPPERTWLGRYCQALKALRPKPVERMLLYGSKARGDSSPESDLDVLLILKSDAAGLKRRLRRVGYLLAAGSEVVPSILAYTAEEWQRRQSTGSPFYRAVTRDEIEVL